jgi:hypothetical protein
MPNWVLHMISQRVGSALHKPCSAWVDWLLLQGVNYMSMVFPGESHHEMAWKRRLKIPLMFLFGGMIGGNCGSRQDGVDSR